MKRNILKIILLIFALIPFIGCADKQKRVDLETKIQKAINEQMDRENTDIYNTVVFNLESEDFIVSSEIFKKLNEQIDLESFSAKNSDMLNIKDALMILSADLKMPITFDLKEDVVDKEIMMSNIKNITKIKLIDMLELIGDIDVKIKDNIIQVKDTLQFSVTLPILENDFSIANDDEQTNTSNQSQKIIDSLKTILNTSEEDGERVDYIEQTSTLRVMVSPNKIRNNIDFIQKAINDKITYGTFVVSLYNTRENILRDLGIKFNNTNEDFSLVSGLTSTNALLASTITKSDLSLSVSALEDVGALENITSRTISAYNSEEISIKTTSSVIYEVPGELSLSSTSTTNGTVSTSPTTIGKPEIVEEDVGLSITLIPKIDIDNNNVLANIKYSQSQHTGWFSTIWSPRADVSQELRKPIIDKNDFSSKTILVDNKSVLFMGIKSDSYSKTKKNIAVMDAEVPMSKTDDLESSNILILVKATLPKKQKNIIVDIY